MNKHFAQVGAALTAMAVVLSGCSTDQAGPSRHEVSHFGYAVNSSLATSNAASLLGVATDAGVLSARIYPPVYVQGPAGQMIPNTDLATTQVLPSTNRQVIYTINTDANYSDGQPVVCDDFLLAAKAGMLATVFNSHIPLAEQIERVECTSGSKQATVVFKEDQGVRWRHLFAQGTLLPAHSIAAKAGMSLEELTTALRNNDVEALEEPARIWNEGFKLENFDPELQVSSGPYTISGVGDYGEVELSRNEHYSGDPAVLEQIVVWPKGTDHTALSSAGNLHIADVESWASAEWVDRDDPLNPYDISEKVGELTEQLTLGSAGVFYTPESRRAFAACVDQSAVAAASSSVSGIAVPPADIQTVHLDNPVVAQLGDIRSRYTEVNTETAAELAGTTIRIGYDGPDARKAAMVEAIRVSCEPAGITVVDASQEAVSLNQLNRTVVSEWGYEQYSEGSLDAVLRAVEPNVEFPSVNSTGADPESTRISEEAVWAEMPSIPLAAQPRVFVIDRSVGNVVVNTDFSGIGWNMDRWSRSEGTNQ